MPKPSQSDERGASLSAFVAVVMVCLLLVAGLVIDGGAQVEGNRRAEGVAARSARAGADAGAAAAAAGLDPRPAAAAAARQSAAGSGMSVTVTMTGDRVAVAAHGRVPVTFLSLIGVTSLPVKGFANADPLPR